ncbi:MAG: hypothetical protein JNL83_39500 [Myxococcales bacterium]|nr:hypothetical protein [Myxococcales bacterium]
MRQAFAAVLALAVLMVIVVVRCGFRDAPETPDAAAPVIADAAVADAPIDAAAVPTDAPPPPKKRGAKPAAKPARPAGKPTLPSPPIATPAPVPAAPVTPAPVPPAPVTPAPGARQCTHPANPPGCPAKEPNVNRPCDAEGVHCLYGTSCCPFEYVCTNGAFEVWISSCP